MSITKKISILFIISLILMSIIGYWIDSINSQRIDSLIKDKYLKIANEIYQNIDNTSLVNQIIKEYKLKPITKNQTKEEKILYSEAHTFGSISIFHKGFDDELILHIKYLEDEYILKTQDEKNLNEKFTLNILVFLDVFVLLLIFLYIIKLLSPLKKITKEIESFSKGDLSARIKIKSNDEIGILANTFNKMANNLEELIKTREALLRDIGHELRTPIAKGKFAIEKIDDFSQKELLKKIFSDLEILTNELIELEKLNSSKLDITRFSAETLILEALDKLYINDEKKINLIIEDDFKIEGDLNYLCITLKNLIDNALKYATSFPIIIKAKNQTILVENKGEKLSKELAYYLKPFTQELAQRNGFGLGLSIVDKILNRHFLKLEYEYKNKSNIFKINFK
ncbi:integral membrane sensor signal transduction histidine kinase [Arcobacter nitrofigilis DSM 7299]|uniref:histidine kinase n=1 Tax=Arcobacter nitrofigilis (strain ATCC 33309 / DSM 7299 / CCUG 15893 / LMG 7604 / NCTC 12251 / CI) TaxID=572480 RepID=D5V818_ARCNC|nr:ArsS family sensor histidine kinase [Arcobacter nitrofigilis]ADG94788.1 integral membrane sensor signal transduction histidine kinase [Arcobacter nitrofigilis DSM 7299]